ncbi:hypothetical protein [Draconibacterium aestuarii]|uniref:hypothetical protein n=1 Tax=Draconibacterium aestuarii TaxID=2998507 RepID=UPI0031BA11D2
MTKQKHIAVSVAEAGISERPAWVLNASILQPAPFVRASSHNSLKAPLLRKPHSTGERNLVRGFEPILRTVGFESSRGILLLVTTHIQSVPPLLASSSDQF